MPPYKFDTHVHTGESSACGRISSAEVVRLYKDAGYDGIVITDHYSEGSFAEFEGTDWNTKLKNYLRGYTLALAEGKKLGLRVFLGIELQFNGSRNEFLVYGIDETFLLNNPALYELNPQAFSKLVAGTGIRCFQAHPFRNGMHTRDFRYSDGIELYNGNARHAYSLKNAQQFALENSLTCISGSDFHQRQDLARGGILLNRCPETSREFASLLTPDGIAGLVMT